MESQPHNPEFRINPENFHPCNYDCLQQGLEQLSFVVFWCSKIQGHIQSKKRKSNSMRPAYLSDLHTLGGS